MPCSSRTRYLLALFSLVALCGSLVTFLPNSRRPIAPPPPAVPRPEPLASAILPRPPEVGAAEILLAATPEETVAEDASPPAANAPASAPSATPDPASSGKAGTLHTVRPGESVGSLAFRYLPQTIYMTTAELESAIRAANPAIAAGRPRPGLEITIPGIEPQPVVKHRRTIPRETEIRAIYLTGWTAGSARGLELIRRWRELGGNAVCFDVKDMDGLVNVPFDHPLARSGRRPLIRSLPKFTRYMHRLGLHVIARIALFRDEHIAKQHPELAVQSRGTKAPWRENGKQVWVDPSNREVQDYNLALAKHVASSGVDEIQFDYVRFPAEGDQQDAQFFFQNQEAGGTRAQIITEFLRRAYGELRPTGVLVSLDVFGVMAWQRPVDLAHTGQDIAEMVRYCDVLSPMIYPSHFFGMDGHEKPGDAPEHFIGASMERFQQITAGSGVILRPWLQAFGWRTGTYSPGYVLTQVNVAKRKGGVGYLFWNANNDYSKPFAAMSSLTKAARKQSGDSIMEEEQAAGAGPTSAPPASVQVTNEATPYPSAVDTLPEATTIDF
jgi:hypothetical protein